MIQLFNRDCRELLRELSDNSIDAIVTDPPYYSTNLHFDKTSRIDFKNFLNECKRILKPAGILVTFADFNLLAEWRSYKIFKSTYELIWQKNRAANFALANKMPMRVHEFIGVFKNQAGVYNPQKIPRSESSLKRDPIGTSRLIKGSGTSEITGITRNHTALSDDGFKNPISVLPFKIPRCKYGKSKHPTQKPIDLLEWILKTYTNDGYIVLDPFMGSGSTGVAAKNLGRKFIGCELDSEYFKIAKTNLE